jgi:uncharacterized membrane protein
VRHYYGVPPVTDSERFEVVAPSRADATVKAGSEVLGGPLGRCARTMIGWWTPVRVAVVVALFSYLFGYFLKAPCLIRGWGGITRYSHVCYSDIPPLYQLRGFAAGYFPYLQHAPGGQPLEYPVLTGMFILVAAWLTPAGSQVLLWFYNVNVVMLGACFFVAVAATSLTIRRRPWDALLVALAPGVILAGTVNWDLFAVALAALSMLAWSRERTLVSGALLGLAIAAKFYPVVIIVAVIILCLRAGRLGVAARWVGAAFAAWLVVNLPFMILGTSSWEYFYKFSATRGQDFGSVWLALSIAGIHVPAADLSSLVTALVVVLTLGVVVLALLVKRRPRLAQVAFLMLAAFVLVNKVYSPQYVVWLIPFAVMARPKWRDFLIWQVCEVGYFLAIWWYLVGLDNPTKGLPGGWYAVAIALHLLGTGWLAGRVVRDLIDPSGDPVRNDGFIEDLDDPGGGVLAGRPDRFTLRRASHQFEVDYDWSVV